MKILVTGGAGFIGSWLVNALLDSGHEVSAIDNFSPQIHGNEPYLSVLKSQVDRGLRFERGDIRDAASMDRLLGVAEAVVHLAAETGTGQSMYQIAHYYDVNQQATAALFEAIVTKHRHVSRVVLASSRSVYGEGAYRLGDQVIVPSSRDAQRLKAGYFEPVGPKGEALTLIPTPESVMPLPASVYAATKLANEALGRVMAEAYGLTVVALRFQNVFGERQSLRNPYTGILSIFSNRMRQGLPINIFEDGLESRDFVHVSDVVRSVSLALERAPQGYNVLNIGSGVATTVMDMARALATALGSSSELQVSGDFRSGDIRHCLAELERAKELLDYVPNMSLEDGLRAFCDWVVTQEIIEDRSVQAQRELSQMGLGKAS